MVDVFKQTLELQYEKKVKRNIWENSEWPHISELENDDVGKVGEQTIQNWCKLANIHSDIDGLKTKEAQCGGKGDGIINGRSVEIKTARIGCTGDSFQHELGECPWNADYMLFLDIAPNEMYVTLFPNFTEEFYKQSGTDSKIKCLPYFPSRSVCWRKQKGAFKLDTSIAINTNSCNSSTKHAIKFNKDNAETWKKDFETFINNIIPGPTPSPELPLESQPVLESPPTLPIISE
jgi:hypothetical protein